METRLARAASYALAGSYSEVFKLDNLEVSDVNICKSFWPNKIL